MAVITIANTAVKGWQGNSNGVQLRIFTNSPFTANSGNIFPQTLLQNPASLGTFFQIYPCTVNGNVLTVPTVTVESTTDSPDNPAATFTAQLWDAVSGKPIQQFGTFVQFVVGPTPTATTWSSIFASNLAGKL